MNIRNPICFRKHPLRFGVADSDLQVIGESRARSQEGSCQTMWDAFARERGIDTPARGCGRYDRWEEDVALLNQLGIRHYRTSVSWSRILREHGEVNESAIAWYHRFFDALRSHGIRVYVTLYHWELPQTVATRGGWRQRETVGEFLKHCRTVHERLDPVIDEYFVLNEPSCTALFGHFRGIHAPGEQSLPAALEAAHHLLLAQGLAVRELHERGAQVSTVINIQPTYAASLDEADILARQRSYEYWNGWFLDPLFRGTYPEQQLAFYGSCMPAQFESDMETIRVGHLLHALGVNYYNGEVAEADPNSEVRFQRVLTEGPTNDLGWPVFIRPYQPEGLYDSMRELYHRYERDGLKRLYITETGFAGEGEPGNPSDDQRRINFLDEHVRQTAAAIRSGVPIEALFVWSFCDSYEWQDGHKPESHFGLVGIDPVTLKRTPKRSALWYSDLIAQRMLPAI